MEMYSFRSTHCSRNTNFICFVSDENTGFTWHIRYKIIKGICVGLQYLREGEHPIMHFDLKPDNILLDENMVPKIADFGLSKLFGEENTKKTMSSAGTW
uniref:non-specific serine/threonine protein kinase n=1 Tax=Aegilops tauschii subsp. strangulata TaxID=200361 RepID=A0A452XBP3_AEGTS